MPGASPAWRLGPRLIATLVGAALAGALAVLQPLVGLAVALIALVWALLREIPVERMAPVAVVATAFAAVAGPNLAAPPAPWLFLFRILIVALGLGVLGYLLMGRSITIPAPMAGPAGLLGVWFCWSALSIGWAQDPLYALRWTSFFAMMAGMAIAIGLLCRDRRRARTLLWWLLAIGAIAGIVAVGEVLTGRHLPTFRADALDRGGLIGVGSLFGNQNNFAAFLSLGLPYVAVLPVVYRDVRIRALGIGAGLAALAFILLSGSKSGLLAAAVVLLGLLLVVGLDRRNRGRIGVAAVMAVLAVVVVVPSLGGGGLVPLDERTTDKFSLTLLRDQIEGQYGSGGVRAALLGDGLGLVAETNGLGVGAGNAEVRVGALADSPTVSNLHNWWLEVLVDGGVVALAIYLVFFLILVRRQLREARRADDPFVRYMCLAGGLSLCGWVIGSVGPSTSIHFAPMWIVFGLGMGSLVLAREARRSAS
ncbi:MAG: O-antigen ligase family protein [Thermoleophilia bacterium]